MPNSVRPTYCYRIELLKLTSEWLTANQRLYWRRRSDITKYWRHYAHARAKELGLPRLESAYVVAELRFADNRRRDPANWAPTAKAAVDGLVDAGVFDDDNHKVVTGPDMRIGPVVDKGWQSLHLLIYPTEKPVKITGEYKACPDCKRPYEKDYPRHTAFTVGRRRGLVEITPHNNECPWAGNTGDDDE